MFTHELTEEDLTFIKEVLHNTQANSFTSKEVKDKTQELINKFTLALGNFKDGDPMLKRKNILKVFIP